MTVHLTPEEKLAVKRWRKYLKARKKELMVPLPKSLADIGRHKTRHAGHDKGMGHLLRTRLSHRSWRHEEAEYRSPKQ